MIITAKRLNYPGDFDTLKCQFAEETLIGSKNKLLSYLKAQSNILQDSEQGFVYKGHPYCISAFSSLTGFSDYILRNVVNDQLRGVEKFSHGNRFVPKNCPRKVNAICWFKAFCDLYGQAAPDNVMTVLPSFLNVTTCFNMYRSENPVQTEQIKFSTFCWMVKREFGPRRKSKSLPWVRFSKHSSHSVCDTCTDLDKFQRTCRSQQDIDLCRALKYKHKERLGNQRKCISNLRQLSQTLPDQYLREVIIKNISWVVRPTVEN